MTLIVQKEVWLMEEVVAPQELLLHLLKLRKKTLFVAHLLPEPAPAVKVTDRAGRE
jgi:hypothetical protein